MSLSALQQKVFLSFIAFPNCNGLADFVYVNEHGSLKKRCLSNVFLNSISFYSLGINTTTPSPAPNTNIVLSPSTVTTQQPVAVTTSVYSCFPVVSNLDSPTSLLIGSIYWNFPSSCFNGYMNILINLKGEGEPALYTYVNCLVSGFLSNSTAGATVTYVNPIILSSNLNVYNPEGPVGGCTLLSLNNYPCPYVDSGVASTIRSLLKGNIQVNFPSGPVFQWVNAGNQYFSAAFSPF